MTISESLQRLGVTLPQAPRPVGSYVPACQAGDLVFVSGVLPFQEGKILQPGKVGQMAPASNQSCAHVSQLRQFDL